MLHSCRFLHLGLAMNDVPSQFSPLIKEESCEGFWLWQAMMQVHDVDKVDLLGSPEVCPSVRLCMTWSEEHDIYQTPN